MKANLILVSIGIIFILFITLFVKPWLHRKAAITVVKKVLQHWEEGEAALAMQYWQKQENSPPINDLLSYEILSVEMNKKGGIYSARISVVLEFPPHQFFPKGKEWLFKLTKSAYGWEITEFSLTGN